MPTAQFLDYWYNLHIVDITGKIVGTSVKSRQRSVANGMNMYAYHPDSHKCMTTLRDACKKGEDTLCRYVSDDGVNYVSIIQPIDRFQARVHEFRAGAFKENLLLEMIDDCMGSSFSKTE